MEKGAELVGIGSILLWSRYRFDLHGNLHGKSAAMHRHSGAFFRQRYRGSNGGKGEETRHAKITLPPFLINESATCLGAILCARTSIPYS